jgi:hypothetical protein
MNHPDTNPPTFVETACGTVPKLHWPLFVAALLLPPMLTFASAMAGWKNFPVACPFVGGGLAGLVCGILLGRRVGRTPQARIVLSIVFILAFATLSFGLCFGGCLAGNYQMDMR